MYNHQWLSFFSILNNPLFDHKINNLPTFSSFSNDNLVFFVWIIVRNISNQSRFNFYRRNEKKRKTMWWNEEKGKAKDVSLFENVLAAMEKGNYRSNGIGSVRTWCEAARDCIQRTECQGKLGGKIGFTFFGKRSVYPEGSAASRKSRCR